MFSGFLPAAASAASGVLSFLGQQDTNESNRDIAEETNIFSAQQAAENRAFQERMSSTSWQRGVADMKKAGVNPMLAVSQGGASSPGGSVIGGSTGAPMQNPVAPAVTSALSAIDSITGAQNRSAQTSNLFANTAKTVVDTERAKADLPKAQAYGTVYRVADTLLNSAKQAATDAFHSGSLWSRLVNRSRQSGVTNRFPMIR